AVAGRAAETGLEPGRTWLATGANWPDALAAGPGAAADGGVLLLVDGDEVSRSPEVERWLDERGADLERVVLVGSRDVVAPNVEAAVRRRFAEPVDVS
ncbi:MAG: cell wall-binding repeat-containing protein, partial [Euzebyaceae bacterium]|nr:cell wall-binding repeat-containing protein [Euzebyaceae bacterium]